MRRPSFRASFVALGVLFVALMGGHPAPAIAEPGGHCTALASPPTPQPQYEPVLPLCTSARHLVVDIGSGSVTNVLPYNGTIGQTLKTSSFAGVGGLDANGKFSPFLSSAFGVLDAAMCDQTGVTCATSGTVNADNAGVAQGMFVNSNTLAFNGVGWDRLRTSKGIDAAQGTGVGAVNFCDTISAKCGNVTSSNAIKVDNSAVTQPANITQFGGNTVATGTGASGVGIPRVTVANDSNILATQSGTWTVQPGNTANTTPWLASINQGGTTATVFGSTAAGGISLSGINALSTLGASLAYNGATLDIARKDSYQAGPSWSTSGGALTTTIAAASAGPNVVKNSAGRLAKAVITTVGTTGTDTFYDNASACSGTVLGTVQGTTAVAGNLVGTIVVFDMPAALGITECGGTGSAAVTASYF